MTDGQLSLSGLQVPRTYGRMRLSEDGGDWIISNLELHVVTRFKQLFPRVPKQSPGPFILRADPATSADLSWFLQRYPLSMEREAAHALETRRSDHLARQAEMEQILLPNYQPPLLAGLKPGQAVRGYQAQAIELAARSGGLLLGDECGLGKTFVGAGLCLDAQRLPAAIVCQVHIQRQWVEVLERFTTLRAHAVNKASPYSLPDADVYVFRYSQVSGWVDVFATGRFRTAIFDEPQELRNGTDTAKGKGAAVLADQAGWRLGLTATPIYGYGKEIHAVMRFINRDTLGSWEDFSREFVSRLDGKLKDPKGLGTYLREQHVFLRRTKADVGKEMPPVSRIVDLVDHDARTLDDIEATAKALALRATTGSFTERGSAMRDLDMLVRQATGVAKARHVAAVVRILVESGEQVLLMGWHRAVYDIWLAALRDLNPVLYTGTESGPQKVKAKEDFLAGRAKVLIMSLRSAAGLDGLQACCSTIVFGELDWSPGVHHQCIERIDREGQAEPVTALFLVTDEGSDPPIMEVIGLKASEAHQVIDPTLGVQAASTDASKLRTLVDRYLERRRSAAPQQSLSGAASA